MSDTCNPSPVSPEYSEIELPDGPPFSPRRQLESSLGAAPSTPRRITDCGGDCSPERTPGPGEGSPAAMGSSGNCEEEYSIEVDGIVAEAEERSNRRAAAIRGVLAHLRVNPTSRDASSLSLASEELPPLPLSSPAAPEARTGTGAHARSEHAVPDEDRLLQPRAHPPPAPVPIPFSGGISQQASQLSDSGELRRSVGSSHGSHIRGEGSKLEQRRLARHYGTLHEQMEKRDPCLHKTMGLLENEQVVAQEATDALLRMEAEVAYAEGMAARKEAELQTEILSLRAEHSKERDRLRSEARRMQASLKELQSRLKGEVEARKSATEQAESLREQLASVRSDLQKRGREGQEAKATFATLEKQLEQYWDLFKWIGAKCTETLGEEAAHELNHSSASGMEAAIECLKRIVGRTLALLKRQSEIEDNFDNKENRVISVPLAKNKRQQQAAAEAAQRLAVVQGELLNYEVQNEELLSRQRALQERLEETEQSAHSKTPVLRTEHRGRLRAAEEGQKKLQKQLAQAQDELQWQYGRYEEEHERMRSRLSALQRAKEASERYIQVEENAWTHAEKQEKELQSECSRLRVQMQDEEANAREARADAVEALAVSQIASGAKRRLEASVEELQAACPSNGSCSDLSVKLSAKVRLEAETVEQLRSELTTLRHEADNTGRLSSEFEEETKIWKSTISAHEKHAEEWQAAAEAVKQQLKEDAESLNRYKQHAETHQAQQSKIDEAKRVMVNQAMAEQEQTLKQEMACVEAAANEHYERAVRELQRCADEHQEQLIQLDRAHRSIAFYEQQTSTLEAAQQQQVKSLAQQEQEICDYGRAELTAMASEQEAVLQARVEQSSLERTEQMIRDALAAAKARHDDELAHMHGSHAAAVAAIHGEYSGELAAMRRLEVESRNELANARLACEAAQFAEDESVILQEQKMESAREEADELRKIHGELRQELWVESLTRARQEIIKDARSNPRNQLRQELCAELREEFHSELLQTSRSSATGSPARAHNSPASCSSRSRARLHCGGAGCSTSGTGVGASPSSIGICSNGSSGAFPSSAIFLPSDTCKNLGASVAFMQELEAPLFSHPSEDLTFSRRQPGVSSAPPSRQHSSGLAETRASGVFRQWTDPSGHCSSQSSSLADMHSGGSSSNVILPPPPQASSMDTTFSSLPSAGDAANLSATLKAVKIEAQPGHHIPFKPSTSLPQPPPATLLPEAPPRRAPSTAFQDQASAVLEMVSRSRMPFRATGLAKQAQEKSRHDGEKSFGHLPPWPGSS